MIRDNLREYFRPINGPVFKGFDDWYGADVVLATGWDTVYPVLRLPDCRARAYLVQDHEPEFFATSAESVFAERTYGDGLSLHRREPVAAASWSRDRYGGEGTLVRARRRPRRLPPAPDRASARHGDLLRARGHAAARRPARRARAAGAQRRRPDLRFVLFGNEQPIETPFAYDAPRRRARRTSSRGRTREATVGLSLSLTNYSLIPQEMLACGLPCVELAGRAIEGVFGADGPIELAAADPVAARRRARAAARPTRALWERRSQRGLAFAARAHLGPRRPTRSRRACARRCASRALLAGSDARADRRRSSRPSRRPGPRAPAPCPSTAARTREATERLYARLSTRTTSRPCSSASSRTGRCTGSTADETHRQTLALVLGAWYEVPSVLEKTGLQRRPAARGRARDGARPARRRRLALLRRHARRRCCAASARASTTSRRGLDFGCSSGRVVRALQAAYPQAEWHGVDPNEPAIAWAQRAPARDRLPRLAAGPAAALRGRRTSTSSSRSRSGRTTASAPRSAGWTRCTA